MPKPLQWPDHTKLKRRDLVAHAQSLEIGIEAREQQIQEMQEEYLYLCEVAMARREAIIALARFIYLGRKDDESDSEVLARLVEYLDPFFPDGGLFATFDRSHRAAVGEKPPD